MRTRLFYIVYVAANSSLVLYGIIVLVMPGILLEPLMLRAGQFSGNATYIRIYLGGLFRLLGWFNLVPGVIGLLLLYSLRLSPGVWIRRIVILSTTLAYLGPVVFDNTVGNIGFFEIVEFILFGLVIIFGILTWGERDVDGERPLTNKITEGRVSSAQANPGGITSRLGSSPTGVWVIKNLISPLQRWVYRISGGRVFTSIGPNRDVLLLTTQGRRTGKDRTIPVFYLRDGASFILCNVRPEFERTNPWVVNLRSNPIAKLQIGRETGLYRAREATAAETESYWPKLVTLWPAYEIHYQRGGRRAIFILEKEENDKVGLALRAT